MSARRARSANRTNLVGMPVDQVAIGMPVERCVEHFDGNLVLPQFSLAGAR
ncbi:MAG: hypothetical protein ACLPVF_08830 [Acidimicrobiales bacterium]